MDYDSDYYKGNVPDEIDGVPVRKNEGQRTIPTCANRSDFDPIPGAVHLNGNGGSFTSFAPATRDGNEYLLTCSHPWDACANDTEGEPVEQYRDQYGQVDVSHSYIDVARTEITESGEDFAYGEIQGENQTYDIESVATEDGVDHYMEVSKTIQKTGISTGDTTGEIDEINVRRDSCPKLLSEGVRLTNRQAEGDSGSPGYVAYDYGDATLININTFGVYPVIGQDCDADTYENSLGTAAYKIEDFGYSFT